MLPKKNRGLLKSEITEVIENGKSMSCRFFKIFVFVSDKQFSQFAVVMPHQIYRTAVLRNRMRRIFYSALVEVYKAWTKGVRVVILLRKGCEGLEVRRVEDEIAMLMVRLGLK